MKLNLLNLCVIALLIFSCSDDDNVYKSNRLSGKTFLFPVVQSQAECDAIQANSIVFNCAQILVFEDESRLLAIFTDIANNATYSIDGDILTVNIEDPDVVVESPLIFTINQNSNVLTRTSNGSNNLWKLEREGVDLWDL